MAKLLLKAEQPLVFERDYRYDNSESAFAMHAFISPTLYLYLECSPDCHYRVEYAFNSCKQEDELRKQLANYSFKGRTIESALQPDFSTFYTNVLRVQQAKHIYSLQA
ncbi:hypothetical protein ABZR88_09695 [Mucilaginibacter yixingensis]|uniref:hypothetical protein n=1 Tax=Mucilaginibacter yixingensis TaxID=1295612 RepID=UPI0011B1ECD2|nr:hypothetical protein [Mucilaginibacter yixingensis]